MLQFTVNNQELTKVKGITPATDSQNYLKAQFTFSEDWENCEKIAVFRAEDVTRKIYLNENNECFVPWEVLKQSEHGAFCIRDTIIIYASVYAIDVTEQIRITTNEVKIEVKKSGYTETAGSSEVPPEVRDYKTTEVNENSTNEQYATAKAVYMYGETKTAKTEFNNFKEEVNNTYTKKTDFSELQTDVTELETDVTEFKEEYTNFKAETEVTKKATGNAITIDSAKAPLANLKLYGKTTQNGTPTPEAPVPLVSVGDSGSFEVGVYGGKNFVEITADTKTIAGVTFTRNADKSFSLSGTGEANNVYIIGKAYLIQGTQYKVTGCPTGGASDKYLIRVVYPDGSMFVEDKGSGLLFTPSQTGYFTVGIRIQSGTVTDGLKFYPMIRYSSETEETYEPCNKEYAPFPYTLRSSGTTKDELNFDGEIYDYFGKGVFTQKNYSVYIDSMENVSVGTQNGYTRFAISNTPKALSTGSGMCNRLNVRSYPIGNNGEDNAITAYTDGGVYFRCDELANATDKDTWIKEHPIHFIYPLKTPIETPITETDFAVFRQIRTNKGNTTILCEAETEIEYYANNANAQAIGNIHDLVHFSYFKLYRAIMALGGNT